MQTPEGIQRFESLLVKFHDNFARHRFDIGMNTVLKVQLTPRRDSMANNHSLLAPNHLKEDIVVEFAPLHRYGIMKTYSIESLLA